MRPRTLAEVAAWTARGEPFDVTLACFLDGFHAAPSAGALAEEPVLLSASADRTGRLRDAYLAAAAEELARSHGFPRPAWTGTAERSLVRPYFASPLASLRAVLILESPPSFRARNIFVSADALLRV